MSSTQQIHRHNYQDRFTIMPNSVVEHPTLSWMAKALLWYLLSRPADWVVYRSQLAKVYTGKKKGNGKDAVDTSFQELMDHGYIVYTAKDKETGRYIHRYDVYPEPQEIQKQIPEPVKPDMGKPVQRLNPPQQSNDSLQRNERQQPEAPPPDPQVVVFSVFDQLRIDHALKESLSSQMDDAKATKLVERVKAWETRDSDAAACHTILARWDIWEDKQDKDSVARENRALAHRCLRRFESVDGKPTLGPYRCEILHSHVEFVAPTGHPRCFSYESKTFRDDVRDFIQKNSNPLD